MGTIFGGPSIKLSGTPGALSITESRLVFKLFDTDRDGLLSEKEGKTFLRAHILASQAEIDEEKLSEEARRWWETLKNKQSVITWETLSGRLLTLQ